MSTLNRPYVISWNLTYRCNMACEHCYLDAGAKSKRKVQDQNFADRSELNTEECFSVIDDIARFAPECLTILTGGEPLLRKDILPIIRYANEKQLWVVVGSNGVLITEPLVQTLKREGLRGMALSLDALDAERHDSFRVVQGAWQNTVSGAKVLHDNDLSFIIQTTVGKHNAHELEEIADFAYQELGAKVWNLYFLVQTGRGQFVSDISDAEYTDILSRLHEIQSKYHQKMIVNAKCAPHYVTTLLQRDVNSPFLKTFSDGAGSCPAGTHYMGIRPNGDVTPCPYLPQFAGNLRQSSLAHIWDESELFVSIRDRSKLSGKCGACEAQQFCGGCRARAFGVTGDILAADPLCGFEVGTLRDEVITLRGRNKTEYGVQANSEVEWDEQARDRMQAIPAFVRGMVIKSVEQRCRERGESRVSVELLDEIRSRMPTPKVFSKGFAASSRDRSVNE